MTAIESKDTDVSDTDSGIIVHSGPDSPSTPLKDVSTHTRALKLKHQALEQSLEICLLELRKLCIREAELTGQLSSDYPLMPEEQPPRVRRRIGASFKLDEGLICQDGEDPELHSLAADLALQSQILEAARRLSLEHHLSKPQKKSRLQQCKREEKKFKDLQEAVTRQRARSQRSSPQTAGSAHSLKDSCMSDDSSLSDVVALDDDMDPPDALYPPAGGSSYLDPLQPLPLQQSQGQTGVEHERSPIQNSPWKESSLDQPYQKLPKPQSACSSRSSSPVGAPVYPERILPSQFIKSLTMRHNHTCSAPSTPELHVRRQYSQSFRLPKNKLTVEVPRTGSEGGRARPRLPQRRCAADFMVRSPDYSPRRLYQSSSEDSSSEHSVSSQASSPGSWPAPPSPTEIPKLCPPPYGFHYGAQGKGPAAGPPGSYKNNNNNSNHVNNNMNNNTNNIKNNYNYNSPASVDGGSVRSLQSPLSPPNNMCRTPQPQRARPEEGFSSAGRAMKAPPPPYSRLVRTPSLNEYPGHGSPVMPREVVSEELKSWHQRNKLQRFPPGSGERLGRSQRFNNGPGSPQPPPYKQGSGSVVLQRAADGTPVQWFVEEDAELVSQV
ncbi:innate immunity activator protein [Gadus chalcogrammus]|uniref:innate immunity activator protein n=1 Tax=Gadus chalcogrammus TaxID=1042646 RepID=UPI0024C3270C|nr:innate immunity activator protein [Gadus chalcogrammus]